MDLDQDGTNDVITGSWPGGLYLFKGAKGEDGKCTFAKPITLTDNAGSVPFGPEIGNPGEPYGVLLNCTPASVAGLFRIDIRPGIVPAGIVTGFQGTSLYATGPVLAKFTGGHTMSSVATPIIALPKDLTFACLPYTNQGWCQDNPKGFLSSALRETIGIP